MFIIGILLVLLCCFTSIFGFGSSAIGSAGNITLGLDLRGGTSVTYQVVDESFTDEELSDTIYKLQLRVAEYSTDATVYQEGTDRITVEIPGVYDTEEVIEELGQPGSLEFVTYDNYTDDGDIDYDNPTVWVTGDQITDAQAATTTDSTTGATEYIVELEMDDEGAESFAEATAEYLDDVIYIVYDGEIISSPTVQSEITDGSCYIDGMESWEDAENLASTIRIGSLSLELEDISSQVVSAKLGDNAVSTSLIAGLIGIALIIIFLILYFRIPGVAAAITMVFYAAGILLLLNAFNLTLTISGIAGIILSIGMAVDGNVIINTRIREELAAGQPVDQAIKLGFKKSTSAILDGNITTLIVAIVLIIAGSGTIQGFGMTLAIGIVLSVITSLVITRFFLYCLYWIGIKDRKYYAPKKIKTPRVFDFIGKRKWWFGIAIVCICAGIVAVIVNGALGNGILNFSIEFVGGVSTTIEFEDDISIDEFNDEIKDAIAEVIGTTDIEGQKVTGSNQFVIKTPELEQDEITAMKELLVDEYGADEDTFETTSISGVISSELKRDAVISLCIAAVCMLLYIWLRFRKLKVALASVIAVIHDVLIVVAFYALFRISAGNSFIACILTIVGYSINATIIIFDRIRENKRDPLLNFDLRNVINVSVSQTLTRALYTSGTTFITVMFLYILGVESMKAFALPLGIGIIAGTFSSIFLSGNLFYLFSTRDERYDEKGAKAAAKQIALENKRAAAAAAADGTAPVIDADGAEVQSQKITANPKKKKKKKRKQ